MPMMCIKNLWHKVNSNKSDKYVVLSMIAGLDHQELYCFFKFINVVSILCYICIEFIILLFTILVISFTWYIECKIKQKVKLKQ